LPDGGRGVTAEIEGRMRSEVGALEALGLSPDEAFVVARMRHDPDVPPTVVDDRSGLVPMLGFAVAAGLAVKIPFAYALDSYAPYALLLTALVGLAAVLTAFLGWRRRQLDLPVLAPVAAVLVLMAVVAWVYPYTSPWHTAVLTLLHAPIAIAVVMGSAYVGASWRRLAGWLDWVRFIGEFAVFFALIAMGGGLLMGLTAGVFNVVGVNPEHAITHWILPLGMGGAVIVAAWLVEAKRGLVDAMAPVLAAIFAPLMTLLLIAALMAFVMTGTLDVDREVLILIDVVLVVVLGLHLFWLSSRRPGARPGWSDRLQLVLLVAAVVIDAVVLVSLAGRIGEYGASPNKIAALGENVLLAAGLIGSAWLLTGFLRGRLNLVTLERWQTVVLAVIGAWALIVAVGFPIGFGFR
jgi:hypothetical protein